MGSKSKDKSLFLELMLIKQVSPALSHTDIDAFDW
jgi:hypothetical protein